MFCVGIYIDDLVKISLFNIKVIKFKKGILWISYDVGYVLLKECYV